MQLIIITTVNINAFAQVLAGFRVLAIPVYLRVVGAEHFFTPPVIYFHFNFSNEPIRLKRGELLVRSIAIRSESIGKNIVRAIVHANNVAQLAFVTGAVGGSNGIAAREALLQMVIESETVL